jgi:pyruvate formate lyase activating enzyme
MNIRGFYKTSLIDYPKKICSVIFIGGCNFRCGFCHNPDIVFNSDINESVSEEFVYSHLQSRLKVIDAVTVTGGEPTLDPDLINFCEMLKQMGLSLKLDTNGSNPRVIKYLLEKKLIDYCAVDVKTSPEKYNEITGGWSAVEKITETLSELRNSSINFEVRTTCVPGFLTAEDMSSIKEWISPVKNYYLQQFTSSVNLINPEFALKNPFTKKYLNELLETAREIAPNTGLRGV